MTIYNLYIFHENGTLLYYTEWHRKKHTDMPKDEEARLLYGMLFSLKSFVKKLSPNDLKQGFLNYKTNKYRLNYYESSSGVKFVLNTDVSASNSVVSDLLHQIYTNIFIEYAIKNPIYVQGDVITSDLFKSKLDELVKSSTVFKPV